ncbi:lipase family protein [Synechococcus sp. BSF8S]|nr:lipase family protein [Synechococcus sp. BSF8S]MBC1262089.1 lipase family protein [Synechococcus sp. BSF8S]MBC1265016.1 lipase family protein [Synechococcus sp. BSA11S]
MSKLSRRQVLLAGLGAGGLLSGLQEQRRRRLLEAEQKNLTDTLLGNPDYVQNSVNRAIEGDLESSAEIEKIHASLNLQSPNTAYDRTVSKILIQCSRLATEQYLTGKFDLRFNGTIAGLPSHSPRLDQYTQVASIKGPDTVTAKRTIDIDGNLLNDPLVARTMRLKSLVQHLAGQALVIKWSYPVFWGFILRGETRNILVLRGTQRANEWLDTLRANQVRSDAVPRFDFKGAIHHGFATIYSELSKPIIAAAKRLDQSKPLYVSGHSLGSPLAMLAALDIAQKLPSLRDRIRLYSYAGPRLGDPEFAEHFSLTLPNTYRVVNLGDLVPSLPPTRARSLTYVHAGEQWVFPPMSSDVGPNHFISAYRNAVEAEQEQLVKRQARL